MNTAMFAPITKMLEARRPQWTVTIEDSLLSLNTGYFSVEWPIIDEIMKNKDYKLERVTMHTVLGQVIVIRYVGGFDV